MTQVSKYPVGKEIEERMRDVFLGALVDVRSKKEAEVFVADFLTPTERIMLPKRLAIALLLSKKYEQRTISQILKVSFTTITRVSNILRTGGAGYRRVIDKVLHDEALTAFIEKLDDTLASILGPAGPGSSNWRAWKTRRWKQKMATKTPL